MIRAITPEEARTIFAAHLDEPVGGRIGGSRTHCPLEYVYRELGEGPVFVTSSYIRSASDMPDEIEIPPWMQKFTYDIDNRTVQAKRPNGAWSDISGAIALEVLDKVTSVPEVKE